MNTASGEAAMTSGEDIVGDLAQGALVARAAEPLHGEGDPGHTHERACLNCGTALIGLIVNRVVGLRPTIEAETEGLDLSDHGEEAYIFDAIRTPRGRCCLKTRQTGLRPAQRLSAA